MSESTISAPPLPIGHSDEWRRGIACALRIVARSLITSCREPLKISQRQAALRLGISINYLNQIELEKSPVSADVAISLSALTGVSAEFWMRLQSHYDLWQATRRAKKRRRVIPGRPFTAEVRAFRKKKGLAEIS